MISSLSLAQSPSKPGTATVQNHRSQRLQLPPASSRQDSGRNISLRRAGALAEPGSPSPPPVAGAMGRAGRPGTGGAGMQRPRPRRVMQPGSASATHLLRQSPPARARPSTSSSHSGSASRPRTVRGPTSAAGQLMPALTHRPSADLLPSSSGPAAARCRRATACWAACQPLAPGAQLAAGDRKLQRRRHRDEGTGLPLAHHRPQANHSRGPGRSAAPPRSAPAPGGTPGSPPGRRPGRPAAPRRSGAHRRSPRSGAARPAPATAPAKRRCAACLPIRQPLARQLVPQERLQPVLGMARSPGPTSATPAPLGVAGHALVLGVQPPKRRRHHYGLGSLVDPHSLGHSRSIHNPGIPVEPPARPVAEAHRVVFAP
jgi:hypothetical protein